MNNAVSVIIPVFNAGNYLRQCINSVISQTLRDIEIICIDDGSTDDSSRILHEYSQRDFRIKLIEQTNKGVGVARNTGLELSNGKYVLFLDADDYIEPDLLESAFVEAEASNADFVMFDAYCFDDESGIKLDSDWIVKTELLPDTRTFSVKDIPKHIFTFSYNVVWNKLYRKDFVLKSGLFFLHLPNSQDSYFACMSLALAKKINYIDRKLIHYRRNNKLSISSGLFTNAGTKNLMSAMKRISSELEGLEFFSSIKQSFFNYSTNLLLWALNKSKNSVYEEMFGRIKTEWFEQHETFSAEYFYQQGDYVQYQSILRNSPQEHLATLQFFKDVEIIDICEYLRQKQVSGNRIALYGAGEIGLAFYRNLKKSDVVEVVAWFDRDYISLKESGIPVSSPDEIRAEDFDAIVVAVHDPGTAYYISYNILGSIVPHEKIICPYLDKETKLEFF